MRFLIEFEGPVCDPVAVWYAAHQTAAAEVGWSRLDQATFWRFTRTKGVSSEILPGARDAKLAEYAGKFAQQIESDVLAATYAPHDDAAQVLPALARFGPLVLVTLGTNVASRERVLEAAKLRRFFASMQVLSADPRRRPAELKALAAGDRRAIVAAGTDSIIRAAGEADLFAVGISGGTCGVNRLHQAGAAIVYKSLAELAASLKSGGADLVRAGLLPAPLG